MDLDLSILLRQALFIIEIGGDKHKEISLLIKDLHASIQKLNDETAMSINKILDEGSTKDKYHFCIKFDMEAGV